LSHDGEYAFDNVSTDELATAAAAFQEDGRSGRHDPEWVRQAMVASSRRQAGDFDGHNAQKFQGIWAEDNEQLSDTDDEAAADENEAMDIDPLQDIRYDHNGRDPRSDDDDDNAPSASRTHQNHSVGNSANSNNSADSSNNGNGSQSQPVDTHPLNQNETSNQVVNRSDFPPPPRCQIIDVTSDAKMEHLFRKSSFLEQLILKVGDVFRAEIGGVSKDAKVIF
jgi:hypothetical protein